MNFMSFVKTASAQTQRAYRSDLEQAFELRKYGKIVRLEGSGRLGFEKNPQCTEPEFREEDLLTHARRALSMWRDLSSASRNRKAATLRSFFHWLHQEGLIQRDLAELIPTPKVPQKLPHFLSVDEVLSVLRALDRWSANANEVSDKLHRYRVRGLVYLLYGAGLRVSEGCQTRWSDLHRDSSLIRILGKGGRERLIALPLSVSQALNTFRPLQQSEWIFADTKPLDSRVAYSWVREAGRRANLLQPLHPHALRHSFATHLLSSGANLRALQELLGHRTLQATQKYTHLGLDELARTLERHHPMSQKKSD